MATHRQQLLQSLCWNSDWNYAVFWKLKRHARMLLTCEDAYYNNNFKHDASESKGSTETLESLHDGHLAHDPLGLAVAKMSYQVYSLGEGIVGQVAVSGKHQWIFASDYAMDPCLSLEICDGWQAQFSAGVKTIVVAAVIPHGVVLLGSLKEVEEDFKLLIHVRDLFFSLQDSSACHVQHPMEGSVQSVLQMSDTSARIFDPDVLQEYVLDVDRALSEQTYLRSLVIPPHLKQSNNSYGNSLPGIHLDETMILKERNQFPDVIDNLKLIQSVSGIQQSTDLHNDINYRSNSCGIPNAATSAGQQVCLSSQSCLTANSTSYDVKLSAENTRVRFKHSPTDHLESSAWNTSVLNGEDCASELEPDKFVPSNPLAKLKSEKNADLLLQFNCLEAGDELKSSFVFSAGSELHKVFGPAVVKSCHLSWEADRLEDSSASQMPAIMERSLLTSDSRSDNLLEAVVANFCRKDVTVKSAVSFSTSESMLTTEKMPEPSIDANPTIGSSCYSMGCSSILEGSMQSCLNSSDTCSIRSSTSAGRNTFVRPIERGKTSKKRSRPGENPRPRPRDRQLIQDRIKELRELVPNGSKCSIDSLLERTIKHMVFMQSVTKHADKLSNCAKSRGCCKETVGSGCEQGSSWAVEVGGHMKICPIVVKNLSVNGQMLIEMLCEDCDHFLEITEAIKGLGLTVLKGMTDNHGDKTWMCFVVEGQSNVNLHRMDVLLSLVQILQSKATA
ncbi:hypothetical protein Cgig2_000684 [Carnegiea gigantea]|uniref:BHLH domain-containing protein n=1 Tax=Carnegiea gigantea TaxID=171969 RepID=A0A9Q1KDC8_9CARY|nr:hypothetical protein Cgig2_000684 [Carnegiea gigantea]